MKQNSADKLIYLLGAILGKLIDFASRLKVVNEPVSAEAIPNSVVNYEEKKQNILFHERRQIKRTILTEFVSAMVVIPEKGLLKVSIFDISEQGVSFDVEESYGAFKIDEVVSMRVYLNHKTYFPISVCVKHITSEKEEGLIRHGAVFQKQASTDAALQYFVKFIESVSHGLKKDDGDLMLPKIS